MTEYYMVYTFADGGQVLRGSGQDGTALSQTPPAGFGVVAVSRAVYDDGLAAAALEDMRAAVWDQVKARRESLIDGGAPTSFGVMDADLVSRVNISGAATAALAAQVASQPFSVDWTNKTNGVVTLSAAEMIQMGMEVMAFVSSCHDRARELRAEIEGATVSTEVLMIDYTAGWPA